MPPEPTPPKGLYPLGFDISLFFDECRRTVMGPTLSEGEVKGAERYLQAFNGAPIAYAAYAFATGWHETAHTLTPVKEYGGDTYYFRMYDIKGQRPRKAQELGNINPGDGIKFCGRGDVQLTGRRNYTLATTKLRALGILGPMESLVDNPELALRPDVSAAIMYWGMFEGWFTTKKFSDYLPKSFLAQKSEFIKARFIINGQDKASLIADYAIDFQEALKTAGWH